MTLVATYPPTAAQQRRPNSGNLLKRDWYIWPEDSTTRTTCLSSFPTYNCSPFTPYDSMASVSKLMVLMPIDMWHRLSKDRKDIGIHSINTIDIPSSANQSGGAGGSTNAPPPLDPLALPEDLVVVGASSLFPPSPPQKEKKGEEEGKEGEPMYIDKEDTGKEKTPSEIGRDAGMWKPLGKVLIRCKWIYI